MKTMNLKHSSELTGFHKLPLQERVTLVKDFANLSEEEAAILTNTGALTLDVADRMIENVIGAVHLPLGIATNFLVNGREYLIPMAIEEPSVVAAASNAAKMARPKGGFFANSTDPVMIGQIQIVDVPDPYSARISILAEKTKILEIANRQDPMLLSKGGGAKDLEAKVITTPLGEMLIAELHVDCRDVMGANAVNTMAEAVAPTLETITHGKVHLRIISNLATKRLARARATFSKSSLGGEDVVDGIIKAYAFAVGDPYRCATHNKGVMNGVTAVVLATGNDTRAMEAGAHAYASRFGQYGSLTVWEKDENGDLSGSIEIPVAVGIIGGSTSLNSTARVALKILGVKTSTELGEVIAAVGLAQNLAALRALATEGIQRGHMRLHARNIAAMAGAKGDIVDKIAAKMVEEKMIRMDRAKELLDELKAEGH